MKARQLLLPGFVILCWALHAALLRWMAGADVVSVLLSGGGASVPMLLGAAAFVSLRLFVRLVLPGVILAWLGYVALGLLTSQSRARR